MLDTAPGAAADICGDRLPGRVRRAYEALAARPGRVQGRPRRRGRHPVDQRGLPPRGHRAPRRHPGGGRRAPSADDRPGRMPERPFVLVGQQYLADPPPVRRRRPPDLGVRPRAARLSRRRHRGGPRPDRAVRTGLPGADRGAARRARPPNWPRYNPNYVGGDIVTGANTARQVALRPRRGPRPVQHRRPRRLPVLGGDSARRRGARHVRCNAARSALRYLAR